MGSEHYCLKWNNHQSNLLGVFSQLLQDESLVDVTLACAEGHSIRAHKVVLSACSSYFQTLFVDHPNRHPIVILKDVCFAELKTLVDFMYKGEVNVEYCQLSALLKTAESLKVKGLAEMTNLSSVATITVKNDEKEEVAKNVVELVPRQDSADADMPSAIETEDKRLMNEDTKPMSPERISSPGPPQTKRPSGELDCNDSGDCDRDRLDLPNRNAKGGCPGPTDMSASGLALCQMPPSCSSPHVSEPFPGTSCLPPVQQVPLSLKKEVDWDSKSATGESSLEFRHPPDSDASDADLDDRYEMPLCGFPKEFRPGDCKSRTSFHLPFPPFGPFGEAGELSARQNCSFFRFIQRSAFVSSPAMDEGRYIYGGGSAPYRCAICLAAFPSSWLLEQHATLQHSINSRNSETGSPGEGKPFKCEQCGQSYRYRSAYFKHQEQNHRAKPPADKLFTCDVCGMQFRYLKSFKKHRLNHALEKLHTKSPNGEPLLLTQNNGTCIGNCIDNVAESPFDFSPGTFTSFFPPTLGEIKESGRVTAPPSVIDGGSDQVTSSNEALGGVGRTASEIERAASVPLSLSDRANFFKSTKNSYPYTGAGSEPLPRKRFKSDRVSDSDEQDETIDSMASGLPENKGVFECRRESPLLNLLRSDSSDRHKENKFSCPFCAKCVRSKENLKLHIRKHTGERPFACLFCGRAFGGKSDLTRHLRIHTGERPYHCEMCGKCFARADYLSKHLTTHVHSHNSSRLSVPQGNR